MGMYDDVTCELAMSDGRVVEKDSFQTKSLCHRGALFTITAAGRKQVAHRFGGGSFQSAGDHRLHFGLSSADRAEAVLVRWPSGRSDRYENLPAGRCHRLKEGDGTTERPAGPRR